MKKNIIIKSITTPLVNTIFSWEGNSNFFYNPGHNFHDNKNPTQHATYHGSAELAINTIYKELNGATKVELFGENHLFSKGIECEFAELSSRKKQLDESNRILFDFAEKEIASGKAQKYDDTRYKISCTEEIIANVLQSRLYTYSSIGGTAMYCPSCETIKTCESVNYEEFSKGKFRRFYSSGVDNVNWFARARKCRTCFYIFETAEVSKKILSEFLSIKKKMVIDQEAIERLAKTGKLVKLR